MIDTGASKRRARMMGAGVVVVVLAVVVGVFVFMKLQKPDTAVATKQTLLKAQDNSFSGKYDAAIASLRTQLTAVKTNEEKLSLYAAIGSNYEAKGDFPGALDAYKTGQALMETYGIDFSVARAAESAGNKAVALDFYKRCQKMIKDGTSKQHAGELPRIEAAITRVGGTP
ncbi:MAG TPA: hypothetical protein VMT30_01645 [Candidatus Saccharimonadia bacterium]|nr:hypothetical protein [Candidatus Saccharimonadia bacterium]